MKHTKLILFALFPVLVFAMIASGKPSSGHTYITEVPESEPQLFVSTDHLSQPGNYIGSCAPLLSYTISGINLTSDVMIKPDTLFGNAEVSFSPDGGFSSCLSIPPVGGSLAATVIYVRNCPENTTAPEQTAVILNSGSGLLKTVTVSLIPVPGEAPGSILSNVFGFPGSEISVALTTENFSNISRAYYSIEFNHNVLSFNSVEFSGLLPPQVLSNLPPDLQPVQISDELSVLILDLDNDPGFYFSFPVNVPLLELRFSYISGSAPISFTGDCFFTNAWGLTPADEPYEDYYYNGSIAPAQPVFGFDPPQYVCLDTGIFTGCGPAVPFTFFATGIAGDVTFYCTDFMDEGEISLSPDGGFSGTLTLNPENGVIDTIVLYGRTCNPYSAVPVVMLNINTSGLSENYAICSSMQAGNAPVSSIGNIRAEPGETVNVPVFVSDYEYISFGYYSIEYDPEVLTYQGFVDYIPGWEPMGLYQTRGKSTWTVMIGYTSDNYITLPDSTKMFDLIFTYNSGYSDLTFTDCSFQKLYYLTPNDSPYEDFYRNGSVGPASHRISVNLMLESLFNPQTGVMLKARNQIGEMYPGDIADMVSLSLFESENSQALLYQNKNVELHTNGSCAVMLPFIPDSTQTYYLVINHRNSIETWSAVPLHFTGDSTIYNFTDAAGKAYGNNLKEVLPGTHAIYCGDPDQNGAIDSGDMTEIDNGSALYQTGYLPGDVNGDGLIDTTDFTLTENNSYQYIMTTRP